jgi:hypothetical protein
MNAPSSPVTADGAGCDCPWTDGALWPWLAFHSAFARSVAANPALGVIPARPFGFLGAVLSVLISFLIR